MGGLAAGGAFVVFGLIGIYLKYRVILGGTLHMVDIWQTEVISQGRGGITYVQTVRFVHNGERLTKTLNTRSPKVEPFLAYYNPKYPNRIEKKDYKVDLYACVMFITLGMLTILGFFVE